MTEETATRPQTTVGEPPCRQADDTGAGTRDQKTYQFDELSGGSAEVLIVHGEDCYRLRRTRNGKLLLNK